MVKWCPAVDISNHDVRTHVQKYRTCFSVKQEKQEDHDKTFSENESYDLKRLYHAICYLFEKLKCIVASAKFKFDGSGLLFKTVFIETLFFRLLLRMAKMDMD